MYLKKIINRINKINFETKVIYPTFKRNDQVQLYWYRFLTNRLELIITKGTIIGLKKKQNLYQVNTITIQQKLYGIVVKTKFQLNSISLIGIRRIS